MGLQRRGSELADPEVAGTWSLSAGGLIPVSTLGPEVEQRKSLEVTVTALSSLCLLCAKSVNVDIFLDVGGPSGKKEIMEQKSDS